MTSTDNDADAEVGLSSSYFDGDKFDPTEYTRLISHLPTDDYVQFASDGGNGDTHPSKAKDDYVKFASGRIYDLIEQENGLRNNRMIWFANIEGFLWLSFAAAVREKVGWENGFWLMILIPIVGILVCLSAISAIWDADHAVKLLLKKWRTIQEHSPTSPYAVIPVLGLSRYEARQDRTRIPHWHFALYVLIGWVCGLIGVVVTKIGLILGLPWYYYVVTIFVGWAIGLEIVGRVFKTDSFTFKPSWMVRRSVAKLDGKKVCCCCLMVLFGGISLLLLLQALV